MVRNDMEIKIRRPNTPRMKGIMVGKNLDLYFVHNLEGLKMMEMINGICEKTVNSSVFIGDYNINLNNKREKVLSKLNGMAIEEPKKNTWMRMVSGKKRESKIDYAIRTYGTIMSIDVIDIENSDHKALECQILCDSTLRKMTERVGSVKDTTDGVWKEESRYGNIKEEVKRV